MSLRPHAHKNQKWQKFECSLSVAFLRTELGLIIKQTCCCLLQFDDFERARFVNQALVGMWGFLDMAICNAIKHHVEPAIQDNLPFAISGFTFEKLSFGDSPFQIRGIKHASLYSGTPSVVLPFTSWCLLLGCLLIVN